VFAHHGVPEARLQSEAKPPKVVSMHHADKFHYVAVQPEDVQGHFVQEAAHQTGSKVLVYNPIDHLNPTP
jgi:hypothetical protein